MTAPDPWPELITAAEAIRASVAGRDPWLGDLPIVGVGWATVELDRAARELAGIAPFERATRDAALGATARRARLGDRRGPSVMLLEPDTEGLLAASLARSGEGVAAVYLRALDRADVDDTPNLGPPRRGPLGRARLVIGRPRWGPHALVLAGVSSRRRDE